MSITGSSRYSAVWLLAVSALVAPAQDRDRRAHIDVDSYIIDAEINPRTQTLTAKAEMRFTPLEDRIGNLTFELNNALNVSRVTDETGRPISISRTQQDFTLRLSLPDPLTKGKPATLIFQYEGQFTGKEESPIYGIRFASIQNDYAYLLYPSRWFPVNDYQGDRFKAEIKLTVPKGFRPLGSGIESKDT